MYYYPFATEKVCGWLSECMIGREREGEIKVKRDNTDGTKNQAERLNRRQGSECEKRIQKIEGRRVKNET